jgi:hypothetical protein
LKIPRTVKDTGWDGGVKDAGKEGQRDKGTRVIDKGQKHKLQGL